jgi:hypothetical protein
MRSSNVNYIVSSVNLLRNNGILVVSFDKLNYPKLLKYDFPDAVFLNNTFNTWSDGTVSDIIKYKKRLFLTL